MKTHIITHSALVTIQEQSQSAADLIHYRTSQGIVLCMPKIYIRGAVVALHLTHGLSAQIHCHRRSLRLQMWQKHTGLALHAGPDSAKAFHQVSHYMWDLTVTKTLHLVSHYMWDLTVTRHFIWSHTTCGTWQWQGISSGLALHVGPDSDRAFHLGVPSFDMALRAFFSLRDCFAFDTGSSDRPAAFATCERNREG